MIDVDELERSLKREPLRDKKGNFLGFFMPEEHRTVGDYRAWSFLAHEWCYPKFPCAHCFEQMIPDDPRETIIALIEQVRASEEDAWKYRELSK